MVTVSDHRPSSDDVIKLVNHLKTDRLTDTILTKKMATKLRKHQDKLVTNYTYTKEDVDMLVNEKKKDGNKPSNIGLEKTRIAIAIQAASNEVEEAKKILHDAEVGMESDKDYDLATNNLMQAKEELEWANRKLAERTEELQRIHKEEEDRTKKLKKSPKIQNWVKVNQRAQMANKNADFESYKVQFVKDNAKGSAEFKFDPYARRSMKPKNLWEVGGGSQSNDFAIDLTGSSGLDGEEKKESTECDGVSVEKEGNTENRRDDEIEIPGSLRYHFAFDEETVINGDIADVGGFVFKKMRSRARKGLSLEEYQERRAAGTLITQKK